MIGIPFNPNIISGGAFTLSWHGVGAFLAVAVAVYLINRWARREGLDSRYPGIVFNTAIWAILGGVIGARLVHVIDHWGDVYTFGDFWGVFEVWRGGIGLWGAILGGWLAGSAYAFVARYPVGRLADLAAPAMLIAQTIGRVGDVINGEHLSRATDLPWGWYFTHPESPGRQGALRLYDNPEQPVHPAVVYEMIWNMLCLAVLWRLKGRLTPDGSLWMVYLALYAIGRMGIQFLRLDPVKFWGLQEAHIIAILVLLAVVPILVFRTRLAPRAGTATPEAATAGEPETGAEAGT